MPVLPPVLDAPAPIGSLLIKPASALCNLDCAYCFYLDRDTDPYAGLPSRLMSLPTLERLVRGFLQHSYPNSTFAFQGGEPALAGIDFFEALIRFEKRYGRDGQNVSNAMQTNGILLDDRWAMLFREYNWLVGISLDGTEAMHDRYRVHRGGQGTWKRVVAAVELLQRHTVEFNVLCVLSEANVSKPRELYRFFRSLGVDNLQFIPLASLAADDYGRFLCELFDIWWPHRRSVRLRFFDNLAEAVAGVLPGACTLQDSCDSYAVVEYNGDVYPCDFFVEPAWKLGNVHEDSFDRIARSPVRAAFAAKKSLPHPACLECEWEHLCLRGCPYTRQAPRGRFEDLDPFCAAYKRVFAKAVTPLRAATAPLRGEGPLAAHPRTPLN